MAFYLNAEYLYLGGGKTVFLSEALEKSIKSINKVKFYRQEDGKIIGISNTFFVKVKDLVELENLTNYYRLSIKKKYSINLYLVETQENIFEMIEILKNDNRVLDVYPNLFKKAKLR